MDVSCVRNTAAAPVSARSATAAAEAGIEWLSVIRTDRAVTLSLNDA